MGIRSKMLGSMVAVIFIFVLAIAFNVKNSRDLQNLSKTSELSYGLSNAFLIIYNDTLSFQVEDQPIETHINRFETSITHFENVLTEFNSTKGKELLDPELQKRWENINKLWNHTKNETNKILSSLNAISKNSTADLFDSKSFREIISDMSIFTKNENYMKDFTNIRAIDSALSVTGTTVDILNKALSETRESISKVVESNRKTNTLLTYISTLVATLSAILFSIIFSNSISKKISIIKEILNQISSKNLDVNIDIKSKDEFKELAAYVTKLIASLHSFIRTAGKSVDKVTETKDVISNGTKSSAESLDKINKHIGDITYKFSLLDKNIEQSSVDISKMNTEILNIVNFINRQSDAVASSSSSIEEMTASVSQIANLTTKKQGSTTALLRVVASGGVSVENTFENIQKVSDELVRVKELVEVIKNVADQTNILSMNAAIESAHAGDAGKGFSVVADEIRSLAEYTSNNVHDINEAIKSISNRIGSSLKASEESSIVFEKINKDVNDFMSAMAEISSSMEELAAGGVEVLDSTNQLSSLNHEVFSGAGKIKEQSSVIESAMKEVQVISRDVNSNIKDISYGTDKVLKSFEGIEDISIQSGIRIEELSKKMHEYKLAKAK